MENEKISTDTKNIEQEKIEAIKSEDKKVNEEEIFLRIYDISKGMAKILSMQILGFQVDGVWHTSIEAYGNEYFFHGGLVVEKAGKTVFNPCIDRISLGKTSCSKSILEDFFVSCGENWNEKTYDFFDNNCNNFTNWLANFLVGKDIPRYILDLPQKVKKNENFRRMFGI